MPERSLKAVLQFKLPNAATGAIPLHKGAAEARRWASDDEVKQGASML